MSNGLIVNSQTQRIVVSTQQRIVVEDRTANVVNSPVGVTVIPAGPIGPPGVRGLQGLPGLDADMSQVDAAIQEHIDAPEPHPVYDDMVDLTILLENGLF